MRRILFLLFLFFSSFAFCEISVDDLATIEDRLQSIKNSTGSMEIDIDYLVKRIDPMVGYVYQILQAQGTAESTRLRIEGQLSGLKNLVEVLQTDVHSVLPSLDSNLSESVRLSGLITDRLTELNTTVSSIYSELSTLGLISEELQDFKNMFESWSYTFDSTLSILVDSLQELSETVQNIYNELLSQGYDIKKIADLISGTRVFSKLTFYQYSAPSTFSKAILSPAWNLSTYINSYTSTNLFSLIEYGINLNRIYYNQYNHILLSHLARMYDIQTNFYSSIKLQKDISTNVAYIASVITNSHDLLKLIASNVVNIARHTMPTNIADQYETQQQEGIDQISSSFQDHENDMSQFESQLTRLPAPVQNRFDDGANYISRLSSSNLSVDRLDDEIFSSLPDYHSSLANRSFSLPITTKLTPDAKQIFAILRKCVTTTIWFFTFLFTLFMIQKFLQFVSWIMSLLNPITRDVFGNTSSGSLYRLMGG